jgi:hypothetical protein
MMMIAHPQESTNYAVLAVSAAFGIALCASLLGGGFLVIFVFVNFITRILEQIWPTFMAPKRTEAQGESPSEQRAANRKIAYDYVLEQSRLRRKQESNVVSRDEFNSFRAQILRGKAAEVTNISEGREQAPSMAGAEDSWDLEHLGNAVQESKAKPSMALKEIMNQARFHLLRFPGGPQHAAHYLCGSSGRGESMRHVFAPVRGKSLRMDWPSAHSLAATMSTGTSPVFVCAANSAARIWMRNGDERRFKALVIQKLRKNLDEKIEAKEKAHERVHATSTA